MYRTFSIAVLAAVVLFTTAGGGRETDRFGAAEMFPGEGIAEPMQHGMTTGHLPPVSYGVKLVGKAEVTNPAGTGNDGRVADVWRTASTRS